MTRIGIDLGTTYSLAGHVNAHNIPALFPDANNADEFRTPSLIHIQDNRAFVGKSVQELLEEDADTNVARLSKLKLGQEDYYYEDNNNKKWTAHGLNALIIKKLLKDVDIFADTEVEEAVVTIPAQFNDKQRKAVKAAATLAGLPKIRLVEEPVAAATFYGCSNLKRDETILVYDLGGGTFDSTILQKSEEGLFVLSVEGTAECSGAGFDNIITELIAQEMIRTHGIDPRNDAQNLVNLNCIAEIIKIKLSNPGKSRVKQTIFLAGKTIEFVITKKQFENLIRPLIIKSTEICKSCLESAMLTWTDIDRLVFTGGSTLIPEVRQHIQNHSEINIEKVFFKQPHQAVAYGAALIAKQSFGGLSGVSVIKQVATASLGLRVYDPQKQAFSIEVLIEKNMPLPAAAKKIFYTTRADQKRIILELVQLKSDCIHPLSLGKFAFGPIASPRKNHPLEVSISYDSEGLVQVKARDPDNNSEIEYYIQSGEGINTQLIAKEKKEIDSLMINL